jgi:hypothetical protein
MLRRAAGRAGKRQKSGGGENVKRISYSVKCSMGFIKEQPCIIF